MIWWLFLMFLCWGSFLNVLAYRCIHYTHLNLFKRSACPHCRRTLAWYDLIPVVSWLMLKGTCRYCHKSISYLYPLIEITTAFLLTYMYVAQPSFFWYHFIFFSALLINIRTDIETMLLCRYFTLNLIPVGIVLSLAGLSPISVLASISGALIGYMSLRLINAIFYKLTHKNGIGEGDWELLAMIGSFVGPFGIWIVLSVSSILGTLFALGALLAKKLKVGQEFAFGPFLAIAAIIVILFNKFFIEFYLK